MAVWFGVRRSNRPCSSISVSRIPIRMAAHRDRSLPSARIKLQAPRSSSAMREKGKALDGCSLAKYPRASASEIAVSCRYCESYLC
jgi:hypothetical protein